MAQGRLQPVVLLHHAELLLCPCLSLSCLLLQSSCSALQCVVHTSAACLKNSCLCIWSVQMICMLAMLCKLLFMVVSLRRYLASHLASYVMYYCPWCVTLQPVIVICNCPLNGTDDHLHSQLFYSIGGSSWHYTFFLFISKAFFFGLNSKLLGLCISNIVVPANWEQSCLTTVSVEILGAS